MARVAVTPRSTSNACISMVSVNGNADKYHCENSWTTLNPWTEMMKLIFVQLKVLHLPLNVSRLMILSATSNVRCFLLCIVFTTSTCMFYNYCVCRSTVSALCALLSCSAAICQMIMSMWLSIWTNKWWWWWWRKKMNITGLEKDNIYYFSATFSDLRTVF